MSLPSSVAASLAIPLPFHRRRRDMADVVERMVRCFERAEVGWCLVSAHAVGHYTEPRATSDFDFVVDDHKWRSLEREIAAEFPGEVIEENQVVFQLKGLSIDLIRSSSHALFRDALVEGVVEDRWRLPSRELLVALKFMAATSAWRRENKKRQDIVDLIEVIERAPTFDRARATAAAAKVYRGAEAEFGELLDRIDRGLPISI